MMRVYFEKIENAYLNANLEAKKIRKLLCKDEKNM